MLRQSRPQNRHAYVILKFTLCVLLISTLLFCLTACSMSYEFDMTDGLGIGYSKLKKRAYIANCDWDGDKNNMTFVIPDEYKGFPVLDLGGYYGTGVPCPFCISLPIDFDIDFASNDDFGDSEYETLVFTVVLGKNISKIVRVDGITYFGKETVDENGESISDILYKIEYRFEVDKQNPVFYSSDGKLYYKSNNELITQFAYA
ncbi:MAG: hypothetical protein K2M36_02925 [Clostridia bacterium]|nr:hypothetical protein [Clostridia bacterium]